MQKIIDFIKQNATDIHKTASLTLGAAPWIVHFFHGSEWVKWTLAGIWLGLHIWDWYNAKKTGKTDKSLTDELQQDISGAITEKKSL